MCYAWKRREMHRRFWLEILKGIAHLRDKGFDRKIILRWILRRYSVDWIELPQDRTFW
jgi:hypothetical protein